MSLLFRSRPSTRASGAYQAAFSRGDALDFVGTDSAEHALRLVPLFAAHRLIIDTFASTPLHGYTQEPNGQRDRMRVQPLITERPSVSRMSYTWKAQLIAGLLTHGNAVGVKLNPGTMDASCEWLDPCKVRCDETGALPVYSYNGAELNRDELLHIAWIVPPGKWWGLSPLKSFQLSFQTGTAAQRSARDWFVNGAQPSGHLKNNQKTLSQTESDEIRRRYKAAISGRDVLVTGTDWDYTTIGVPADEARFIEMLKLTATQIAAIYGLPPERIGGESGKSLTYSTMEQDQLMFMSNVLAPWFVNVEEALTTLMPRGVYLRFNADVHVRTDLMTRMTAYETAQRAGVLTNDEVRALEDRPPLNAAQTDAWMSLWRNNNQQQPAARQEGSRGA